ncbi:hypothetical protein [Cysteiniphilum halobium]|uniref:hypothetical protein n=1 Tax=Cysteiniphilum halobium TaxID=2219059 RepID=UPI003F83F33F
MEDNTDYFIENTKKLFDIAYKKLNTDVDAYDTNAMHDAIKILEMFAEKTHAGT